MTTHLTLRMALPGRSGLIWLAGALLVLGIALLPWGTLGMLGFAACSVLALFQPVVGVYLLVLSVPLQEVVTLPGGLSYTQASVLVASIAWGLHFLSQPSRPLRFGALFPAWAFLLWTLLLSTSFTPFSTSEALRATARWVVAFLAWWLAINLVQQRWQIIGLVICLLAGPLAEALLGLWQFATGAGPISFRLAAGSRFSRAFGTIGTPNTFAGYLNMAWPLAVALAFAALGVAISRWRSSRALSVWLPPLLIGGVAALMLAALAASFSRGSWLGAAAGMAGLVLAFGLLPGDAARRGRWSLRQIAAIALVVVGILGVLVLASGVLPDTIESRLSSITRSFSFFNPATVAVTPENFAVVERMSQLWAGWRMFVEHPLLGVGPGNYTNAYPTVAVSPWYVSKGHAHNYYLHMAAEAGALGLLAYLTLIGGVIVQVLLLLRRAVGVFWRGIAVGVCGIIFAVAVHSLFENLHVLNLGIQLSGVWALLTIGLRSVREEQPGA